MYSGAKKTLLFWFFLFLSLFFFGDSGAHLKRPCARYVVFLVAHCLHHKGSHQGTMVSQQSIRLGNVSIQEASLRFQCSLMFLQTAKTSESIIYTDKGTLPQLVMLPGARPTDGDRTLCG